MRQRRPLPPAIANAPELVLGLELFFIAFMDLTSERSMGFAEGPIPWSAVRRWCRASGIKGSQRDDVHYHVNKLDTTYLEFRAKQSAKKTAADGPKTIRPKDASNRAGRR